MIGELTNTERRVLEYFFRFPGKEVHIRGLAEELDLPYSSVREALMGLERESLLEKDEKSRMTFFSASESDRFLRLKKVHNINRIYSIGLVDALDEELRPEAIVLFGSYLDGRDHEESDIDIAVLNGKESSLNLDLFEEELGRSIHLVELDDLEDEEKEFKNTLANGLVLKGYLELVE